MSGRLTPVESSEGKPPAGLQHPHPEEQAPPPWRAVDSSSARDTPSLVARAVVQVWRRPTLIGKTLEHYRITAVIGAGGMGEVYRATDATLGREVALKLLPSAFASDPERLARFEREARLLASLNHTSVAHLYGFETASLEDGSTVHLIAMELVEGEDLADRLKRGAIPVDEAIGLARQIAEGLEEAHEKGIVHRDLKPANIKLTPDGKVKILDFGLAKAWTGDGAGGTSSADISHSPTMTRATEAGMILGTAAYMSPEQARGKSVDKRADIWAFGVVLFEMLVGRRLFSGETVSDTLAAVLKTDPDWSLLPKSTPPALKSLLRRCLERDPKRRLRDIGEARHQLEPASTSEHSPTVTPPVPKARVLSLLPWLLSTGLALAAIGLWSARSAVTPSSGALRQFAIDLPWQTVPNWNDFDAALSADGSHIAYYGRRENDVDVYVRSLDSLAATPLAEAREAEGVVFSPDGEWLALRDSHGLRKVSIHGGRAQTLARIEGNPGLGLTWGPDGNILLGDASGLLRTPSSGGSPVSLTHVNAAAGETGHAYPFYLPGGRHALMTIQRGAENSIAIVDIERATYTSLPLSGDQPAYFPSGHIVFRQGATALAARFDLKTLRPTGEAVPVLEGVEVGPYPAADGSMLYVPVRGDSGARLLWVDRTGHPTPIQGERLDYTHLALASGGRQALLNIGRELLVRDLERGTRSLLSPEQAGFPIWTADGKSATYGAWGGERRGIYERPADGSGGPRLLYAGERLVPTSWNPRTGDLAFFDGASDIWILSPDGKARKFLDTSFNERSGQFSPDGRWLVYVSDETGSYQVYVVPYPGPGPKVAVSVDGGLSPLWSPDGRQVFFRKGGKVMAVSLTFSPALSAARAVELFDGPYTLDLMGHQRWAVAPDGRFLMVENSDPFRMVLVQNWKGEAKR